MTQESLKWRTKGQSGAGLISFSCTAVGGVAGLVVVGDAGLDASVVVLRLGMLAGPKNFVRITQAVPAMEIENSSSEKGSPDAQLHGTQNLAGQFLLCAEISPDYELKSHASQKAWGFCWGFFKAQIKKRKELGFFVCLRVRKVNV